MQTPLFCWDIFMMSFYELNAIGRDELEISTLCKKNNWQKPPISIIKKFKIDKKVVLITDSNLKILFATNNMFSMNGYRLNEVIGKSPKMFQGDNSELSQKKIIRLAIENKTPFETIITNYKKNGETYKCHIEGYPIFNKKGVLVNYIALENVA